MVYFARRYAYNQTGTWHAIEGDYTSIVPTGTQAVCGYTTAQGGMQSRSLEKLTEFGSIMTCGRCLQILGRMTS